MFFRWYSGPPSFGFGLDLPRPGISPGAEHPAIRNIAQSYIQGLPQNLAFFLAKSGQQAGNWEMDFGRNRWSKSGG